MALRPPVSLPDDIRSFSKWCQETIATQAEAAQADNAALLNSQPGSYYTNASNISTGTLAEPRIASTIARDTEVAAADAVVTAAFEAADAAHVAAADPHTVYPLAAGAETISGAWAFSLPPVLPTYTVATLPSAATYARGLIYVSNQSTGAEPAFSDGTNWRIFSTRAIVS